MGIVEMYTLILRRIIPWWCVALSISPRPNNRFLPFCIPLITKLSNHRSRHWPVQSILKFVDIDEELNYNNENDDWQDQVVSSYTRAAYGGWSLLCSVFSVTLVTCGVSILWMMYMPPLLKLFKTFMASIYTIELYPFKF